MEFDEYQKRTRDTAVYPGAGTGSFAAVDYCLMGLAGEVGTALNLLKKAKRGDDGFGPYGAPLLTEDRRAKLVDDVGDALWYLARLSDELGTAFGEVAEDNLATLRGRKERGTLHGTGDGR